MLKVKMAKTLSNWNVLFREEACSTSSIRALLEMTGQRMQVALQLARFLFPCVGIERGFGDFDVTAKAINLIFKTHIRASDLVALESFCPLTKGENDKMRETLSCRVADGAGVAGADQRAR